MSRPLRVLTIGHSYCVAINRAVVRAVAEDKNFDVTVLSPRFFHGDLRPVHNEPEPPGSRLKVVPIRAGLTSKIHLFFYDPRKLTALIRDGDFDVIHAWEEPYIFAGYQIARAARKSRARVCFSTCQNYDKVYPFPFSHFERAMLARSQGWTAFGEQILDVMTKRGYPRERGRYLPFAVDLDTFKVASDVVRREELARFGLKGPVIGFIGRLVKDKGLDVLMQALEKVPKQKFWSLLVLGSGPYRGVLLDWAERNGIRDRVHIALAQHGDMPRHVASLDLLVAPSQTMPNWKEQFGRMLIEAFASGVPVTGSDSGEIPFVIGEAGIVVGEKDVDGWQRAIERLLDSEEERRAFRAKSLERAKSYSVDTVASGYREFFSWLSDQKV